MQIEINEMGSKAFYEEAVNAAAQYRYLLKDHHVKLKNYFSQYRTLLIVGAAALAVQLALILAWGADTYRVFCALFLLIAVVLTLLFRMRLCKMRDAMMADPHRSVLTLDESGVQLETPGTQMIRIDRNNVAVIRIFTESVCFVPAGGSGIIVAVARRYEGEILPWLRENWPEAEIV